MTGPGVSRLIRATSEDLLSYYEWANDPDTRAQSIRSEPITLEEHTRWFREKLRSAHSYLYVAWIDGARAGQIRFELERRDAVVHYSVARERRGRGLGTWLLQAGCAQLTRDLGSPVRVVGFVKPGNEPSLRAFRRARFAESPAADDAGLIRFERSYDVTGE